MFTNLGIARFGSILTTSRLLAAPTGDDEEDDDKNDGYGSTSSRGSAVSSSSVAIFSSTFKGKHRRALRSLAGTHCLWMLLLPEFLLCMLAYFSTRSFRMTNVPFCFNSS